jgi:hypothetical protein
MKFENFGIIWWRARDPAQSADLLSRVAANVGAQTVSDQMNVRHFDSEIRLIHSF